MEASSATSCSDSANGLPRAVGVYGSFSTPLCPFGAGAVLPSGDGATTSNDPALSALRVLFLKGFECCLTIVCPVGVTGHKVSSWNEDWATSLYRAAGDCIGPEALDDTLHTGASGLSKCVMVVAKQHTEFLSKDMLPFVRNCFASLWTILAVPACKLLVFLSSFEKTTPMPSTIVETPNQYRKIRQASRFAKSNKTTEPDMAPATIIDPS
mmetsp:Transcript_52638/g.125753  ORF Transcript_52638/g.125753 Transcript_52638/m.125753 type:complete len:211 (-) Transcript_52638:788-1420(-)